MKVQKHDGFFLFEALVAMALLGMLSASVLKMTKRWATFQADRTTDKHRALIDRALVVFFQRHHFLPVPAQAKPDNPKRFGTDPWHKLRTSYGLLPKLGSDMDPIWKPGKVPKDRYDAWVLMSKMAGDTPLTDEDCRGLVPFRTLGLEEKVAKDGYGRWFTYAIARKAVWTTPHRTVTCEKTDQKASVWCQILSKKDEDLDVGLRPGMGALDGTNADTILYVLVSHGRSGVGAYDVATGKRTVPKTIQNAQKQQNSVGQFWGCLFFYSGTDQPDQDFDDRVFFTTQTALVHAAGIVCHLPKNPDMHTLHG